MLILKVDLYNRSLIKENKGLEKRITKAKAKYKLISNTLCNL